MAIEELFLRYAIMLMTTVVVHIDDSSTESMGKLPPHKLPILADSINLTFQHPFSSKKRCHIQQKQIPILPAFAMTAHQAQWQTLENIIIDLQSCKRTEAPYIMASHACSLEGLLILRPFDHRKICCWQSEDAYKEKQ